MSAFVVDPVHIDLVLSVAVNGPADHGGSYGLAWHGPYVDELLEGSASGPVRADVADPAGRALLDECVASVSHRYPGDVADRLPGVIPGFDPGRYEWTDFGRPMSAIECCKAVACYEYQSCEHPGWSRSGARAFCERLRRSLVGEIAGYEEAPWEWTLEEYTHRRRRACRACDPDAAPPGPREAGGRLSSDGGCGSVMPGA